MRSLVLLTLCLTACVTPGPLEGAEPIATKLRDEDAIRSLASCYGRGLDELSLHNADRAKGKQLATSRYETCFDAAVEISVYPVGAKVPFKQTKSIAEWVDFADGFYASVGYSSTRHLMSNFGVEWTGPDSARLTSFAVGPHFLKSPARDAASATVTLEYYSLRYVDEVARGADGAWRVQKKSVWFDEVWRGIGFFPNGNPDGL